MGFKLEPIEIVAISLASLAVLLISSYALYKLLKFCRTSSSASTTPIHDTHDHSVGVYGYTQDNPYMNYPYSAGSSSVNGKRTPTPIPVGGIQPSPSTGHTTLVTPSTGGGGGSGNGQKLKKGKLHSPWQYSKDKDRDQQEGKGKGGTDELVVVTYEDGLRKLGIQPLREFSHPHQQEYTQEGRRGVNVNQYRNVPPINTNVSFSNSNSHPGLYTATPTATTTTGTPHRPEMVERESSRRTYHSIAGRGHGAGRRGYTNTMGTMGSNLLPSYYIETNAGDD
ncbi:hypothetical protein I302_105961 [Kwoniella bestiolae CBS 10118]|uniref:Uncharacterized protein n=1 Tax=Kwoniella bestiolae CBS 10118 TaxID=1296100 RepID=A0A1B9G2N5_9TREE|nr:hypothetical protein I302_05085 [Kwoniella bestiolae CBS 10118]OCF25271.1 hypothetical protein I302_05085 [Kwoniella bestiolae CBS 10118]